MKPIFFIILAYLSSFFLVGPAYSAATRPQSLDPSLSRGLWVWITAELVNDLEKQAEFIKFIKNPLETNKPIQDVFLYTTRIMLKSKELPEWIRRIRATGARVHFLNGDPVWAWQHNAPLKLIDSFVDYQNSVDDEARFDGFQFDIEPHLLPGYKKRREAVNARFVQLLEECHQKLRGHDWPVWFGMAAAIGLDEPMIRMILSYVDYIAVMDYLDRSDRIIFHGKPFVDIADEMGKKVYIGLETQLPNARWGVLSINTFFDEGNDFMEEVITEVVQEFQDNPSFVGIAIHDYKNYRILSAKGEKLLGTRKFPVLPTLYANRVRTIVVDGKLDDWPEVEGYSPLLLEKSANVVYGAQLWEGKEDYSAKAQFAWDKEFLYLALEIEDDVLVQKFTGARMVTGDHIELVIDYDVEGDKEVRTMDNDDFQLGFSPGDLKEVPTSITYWFPDSIDQDLLDSVKLAARKTDRGYTIEIGVPWNLYPQVKPVSGLPIRLNVDPSDTDGDPNIQETLLSSSPHRELANPRTLRTLILR